MAWSANGDMLPAFSLVLPFGLVPWDVPACVPRSTEVKMPLVRRGPRMGDTGCAGRTAAPYLPPAGTG